MTKHAFTLAVQPECMSGVRTYMAKSTVLLNLSADQENEIRSEV